MSALLIFLAMLLSLAGFDLAVILWGADSREPADSPEWERRRQWGGFQRRYPSNESGDPGIRRPTLRSLEQPLAASSPEPFPSPRSLSNAPAP